MTDTVAVAVPQDRDHRRSQALLKAIGLDRVPVEQRELAVEIAKRYELDLLLKHLVLVDGRPYITRDGLLHVAHRSGQLDGIEVTDPELVTLPGVGEFWRAKASVYRKDMARPFSYAGRYPAKGGNARFAPEMAVKVAEVMALRRAFDVSAPVVEERWDVDQSQVVALAPEPTITETIAARRAALAPHAEEAAEPAASVEVVQSTRDAAEPEGNASSPPGMGDTGDNAECDGFDKKLGRCLKRGPHSIHANKDGETWR